MTMRLLLPLAMPIIVAACSNNTTVLVNQNGGAKLCSSTQAGFTHELFRSPSYNGCLKTAQDAGYVAISGDNAPSGAPPPLPASPPIAAAAVPR